jgi:hypothetical protein
LNDFYIDDLLTGSDSKEKLLTIRDQLIKILNSGGFELSKWTSNEATCLPHSNNRNVNNGSVVQLDKGSETKTLGLYWNFSEDQLKYNISSISIPSKITKRNILGIICQIFDPLGLISPVIVSAKVLLQTLWTRNLDWDQASIRQQYWPITGRNKIKQIIHKCISCFRAKPIIAQQKMEDLPVKRLERVRPFINSGLDYCGPILIKTHRGRGKQKTIKAYVCLFICLSTKAIHIELVSDLTADTFLDALKRFVSRRGTVKSIISDNATNFIKANKDLIDLHQFFQNSEISRKLVTTLSNENIQWKFIPPRTPNFGGLWEAGVKSVRRLQFRP